MSRGYICENGRMVEELDYSCDGQKVLWCGFCREKTYHQLTAISSTRGEVWTCLKCGMEDVPE